MRHAGPGPAYDAGGSSDPLDPLVPTAIVETAGGVLLVLAGVVSLADEETVATERCGRIAGCLDPYTPPVDDAGGRALLGAGIGLAAAGGLTLAIVQSKPLPHGERYDSPGGAVAGSILVGLGAMGTGAIVAASTSPYHTTEASVAVGLFTVPALAIGIPLLATSVDGEAVAEAERAAQHNKEVEDEVAIANGAPTRVASPAMLATGITLTSIGGFGALVATGVAVADSDEPHGALGAAVIGGLSLLFLAPGIPLTVAGARKVRDTEAAATPPEVRLGLGSLQVSGSF